MLTARDVVIRLSKRRRPAIVASTRCRLAQPSTGSAVGRLQASFGHRLALRLVAPPGLFLIEPGNHDRGALPA